MKIQTQFNKIGLLLLLLFGTVFSAMAQSYNVTGVVREKGVNPEFGVMTGVTVIEVDGNNRMLTGTTTDINGFFSIRISNPDHKLKFSFIGFADKIVPIPPKGKRISIELSEDAEMLADAVVYAKKKVDVDMGVVAVKKRDVTGSVSVVDMGEMAASHVNDAAEMLQGQVSGLFVSSNSGDPGAGVSIQIRGSASLNANANPLIVLDGVPMDIDGNFSALEDFTDYSRSPLSDVNPDDIQSITVLKDASSTAIYGSRGANGVILITTKRGRAGKTFVTYNGKFSYLPEPDYLPLLSGDDLKTLWLEMYQNSVSSPDSDFWPELRDDPMRSDYEYFNNNTVWTEALSKVGFTQDHSVSLSGGGETVKFSGNVGGVWSDGTVTNLDYQKYTSTFKLDYKFSDKVRFAGNIYYTHQEWNQAKGFGSGNYSFDNPISVAYRRPSFLPIYSPEDASQYSYYYWEEESNIRNINPLAQANNAINDKTLDRVTANISMNAEILNNLIFSGYVSYRIDNQSNQAFFPYNSALRTDAEGRPLVSWTDPMVNRSYGGNGFSQNLQQQATLRYIMEKDKHTLTLLGVQRLNYSSSDAYSFVARNTASEDLRKPNATNVYESVASSDGRSASMSVTGKAIYDYDDRYGLDVGVNSDASSRFGPAYRWAMFPNLGGYWRISSEKFAENWDWADMIKLRASWGRAGSPPNGQYTHISTYNSGQNGYNGEPFVKPGKTQLQRLKWETSESIDFGAEFDMLEGMLYVEAGYYRMSRYDMLTYRLQPGSTGINDNKSLILQNFGDMKNEGFELSVNLTPIRTRDWQWSVKLDMATQSSVVTRWPSQDTEWSDAGSEIKQYRATSADDWAFYTRVREGDPMGTFYGYEIDKQMPVYSRPEDVRVYDNQGNVVYQLNGEPVRKYNAYSNQYFEAGDVNYVDQNNDGKIDDNDIVAIGDATPDLYGGLGSNLRYKNWTAGIRFNYVWGNDVLNMTRYRGELLKRNTNYTTSVMKRWRKPGDITDIPRAVYTGNGARYNNELGGDKYVEDGSYLRIQNISINYNLPRSIVSKYDIVNASLGLSVNNIWNFTGYTGVDPEVSYSGKPFSVGIDNAQTPKQASATLNVKIGF